MKRLCFGLGAFQLTLTIGYEIVGNNGFLNILYRTSYKIRRDIGTVIKGCSLMRGSVACKGVGTRDIRTGQVAGCVYALPYT